jgi:hypothetical protein
MTRYHIHVFVKKAGDFHPFPSASIVAASAREAIDYFRHEHVIGRQIYADFPREHLRAVRVPDEGVER